MQHARLMTVQDLQNRVILEAICLAMIMVVILSAFKRWKVVLCASSALAATAFFSAWNPIMATASIMVYGPASLLLWFELDNQAQITPTRRKNLLSTICWSLLAVGVAMLIFKNIFNIYKYLQ
jgi:peptidoglycan/LPS O-acetylase OafA/YrhL